MDVNAGNAAVLVLRLPRDDEATAGQHGDGRGRLQAGRVRIDEKFVAGRVAVRREALHIDAAGCPILKRRAA